MGIIKKYIAGLLLLGIVIHPYFIGMWLGMSYVEAICVESVVLVGLTIPYMIGSKLFSLMDE